MLPLINLFLSHLLTPTIRTLPSTRQHCSTLLITKILLMSLTGPDNPLLCHYFCYYLKWVYDNAMFTTGDTLTYSYGGLGEEISDLQSLRAKRGQGLRLLHCFPVSGHRLGLLYIISILIHGGQTSNELRLQPLNSTQHWSCWRSWGCPTPV